MVTAAGCDVGISAREALTPSGQVERDRWCCDTIRENRAKRVDFP